VVAKAASLEGAQTAVRWSGMMFDVPEFMALRGRSS